MSPTAPPPASTREPQTTTVRTPIGLTTAGVAVVSFGLTALAALIDGLISPGLGALFATVFVAASVYTALEVRRVDLFSAVIVPPLTFFLVGLIRTSVVPDSGESSLRSRGIDLLVWLAEKAPLLYLATGLAALIVGYRWWRGRSPRPAAERDESS